MRTAPLQLSEPETAALFAPPDTSTRTANGRDRRFPPGWWILPSTLPGLALLIWGIARLF
jgi:hypothetical protein